MGDGAGCLIQIPDGLLRDWAKREGVDLPQPGHYAVAMCFLPQDAKSRDFMVKRFAHFIKVEGQTLLGWRDVPTDITGLGKTVNLGPERGDNSWPPSNRKMPNTSSHSPGGKPDGSPAVDPVSAYDWWPEWVDQTNPDTMVPVAWSPTDIHITVSGGDSIPAAAVCPSWGHLGGFAVTRALP